MHPAAGLEPIEGYVLVSRLGAGGYGEVWQATAPGGLSKAVKIVFGTGDDIRTQQELKSLTRIKDVRHPFLLSLDRYELKDNQLIIVMELAERSLLDRFEECRRRGLPGIPRRELLTYMQDAASALDYMNENFGLLHLDIKPQNLLLVGGRAKVADFGLVKNLRIGGTITGGITPAYATPEAFDGKASPQSDQYSLAIVYQEMLTGERPFPGTTALQLTIQHINSPPLLDALPPQDRHAVGKALSKSPTDRFASCRELVDELTFGRAGGPDVAQGPVVRFAQPEVESPKATPSTQTMETGPTDDQFFRPTIPVTADTPPDAVGATKSDVSIPDDTETAGRIRPTVFIGVGGIATIVMRRLRQKFADRFGADEAAACFRFLLIDTDKRSFRIGESDGPAERFFGEEILPIPLKRTEDYRNNQKELLRWLDRKWLFSVPKSQTTEGVRPFGRLALIDNAETILDRLRRVLGAFSESLPKVRETMIGGMPVDNGPFQIVTIASMVGGSGSGAVLDLGYMIRQTIAELRLDVQSLGMLTFLTTSKPTEKELARTNAYALLTELAHWTRHGMTYPGETANGILPGKPGEGPFHECYMHHFGDELDQHGVENAASGLAEYLFLSAATTIGNFTHRYRWATVGFASNLRSFGISRVAVPRFRLAHITSESFCRYLIDKWSNYPGTREDVDLSTVVKSQTTNFGFDPGQLASHMELHAATAFETDNRRKLNAILLERPPTESMASMLSNPAEETTVKLMQRVNRFLGSGKEILISRATQKTRFESDMLKHAEKLAADCARRSTDWVVRWIEDPQERLYVAEKLAREFALQVAQLGELARESLAHYQEQREQLVLRLMAYDDAKPERTWLFGKKKDRNADRMEVLLAYFEIRIREIAIGGAEVVLRTVSAALSDLSQDILAVRQRLSHEVGGVLSNVASLFVRGWQAPRPPSLVNLIKDDSKNVDELAKTILESVMPEALFEFDVMFQKKILAPAGGLWQNVMHNQLTPSVRTALIVETRKAMMDAFREIDAAQLFLQAFPKQGDIDRELAALIEKSKQHVLGENVHLLLAAPPTQQGERLLNEMRQRLGGQQNSAVASDGDIIVLCESAGVTPAQAAQRLLQTPANYSEYSKKVLGRTDVAWTPLFPG